MFTIGSLAVEIQGLISPLLGDLQRASAELTAWAKKTRDNLKPFEESAVAVGAAAASMGMALGGAVKVFSDFEAKLNGVKAVSGATDEEIQKLKASALDLGAKTQFSASQAADGYFELGKAGFTATEQLGALPGVMDLAAAGAIKIGGAAEIASGILRGFGLAVDQAGTVADQLAQAANSSSVDVGDLGMSFKYIAPLASAANQDLSEMTGILATLGNQMIKGDQAGTSIRAMLVSLTKPSKEASGMMADIGLSIQDAHGKMLPLSAIIAQLREKTAKWTEVQRAHALATMFGAESLSAVMALVNQAPGELEKMIASMDSAGGAAKRMADQMNKGLKFQMDQLAAAVETLALKVGEDLAPAVGTITELITGLTNAFASMPAPVRQGLVLLTGIATIGGALMAAIGGAAALLPVMAAGFAAVTSPLGLVVVGLSAIAAVGVAVAGALRQTNDASLKGSQALRSQVTEVEKLEARFLALKQKTHLTKTEEAERLAILKKLEEISPSLVTSYNSQGDATDVATDATKRYVEALKEKLRLENEGLRKQAEAARETAAAKRIELSQALQLVQKWEGIAAQQKAPTMAGGQGFVSKDVLLNLEAAQARLVGVRRESEGLTKAANTMRDQYLLATGQLAPGKPSGKGGTGTGAPVVAPGVEAPSALELDKAKFQAGAIDREEYLKRLQGHIKGLKQNTTEYWQLWGEINKTQQDVTKNAADHERGEREAGSQRMQTALTMAGLERDKGKQLSMQLSAYQDQLQVLKSHDAPLEEVRSLEATILGIKQQQVDLDQERIDKAYEAAKALSGLVASGLSAVDTTSLDEKKAKRAGLASNLADMEAAATSSQDQISVIQKRGEISTLDREIAKDQKAQSTAVPQFLAQNAGAISQLPDMFTKMAQGLQAALPGLQAALPALAPMFTALQGALGGLLAGGIGALAPIVAAIVAVLAVFMLAWQQNAAGIQDAFSNLVGAAGILWEAVVGFLQPVIDAVGFAFSVLFNALALVMTVVGGVIKAFVTFRDWVWNLITSFGPFKAIIDGIGWAFNVVWDALVGFYNWIAEILKWDKAEPRKAGDGAKADAATAATDTADQFKLLPAAIGSAVKTGLQQVFGTITQFNPLPVEDVARGNFFSAGPVGRWFVERDVRLSLDLTVNGGSLSEDEAIRLTHSPGFRDALNRAIQDEQSTAGLRPAFGGF